MNSIKTQQKYFDVSGKDFVFTDESEIMARSVTMGNKVSYFVRVDIRNKLYDPNDVATQRENQRTSNLTGQPISKMIKTTKMNFDLYLQFLRTKNKVLLNKINRGF